MTLKCHRGCEVCETPISLRRIALTILAIILLLCLLSPWLFGQTQRFLTSDFRSVTDTRTGIRSIELCGTGGQGIFFNSGDSGGGSCIDPTQGFTQIGDLVWVAMNNPGSFYQTSCYSAWWHCMVATNPVPRPPSPCDGALQWQAFHVGTMSYAGESLSLGGSLVQPVVKEYVCNVSATPTQTPTYVPSPSKTSGPSFTPTSTPPVGPQPCLRLPCSPPPSPTRTYTTTSTPVPSSTPVPRSPTPTAIVSRAPVVTVRPRSTPMVVPSAIATIRPTVTVTPTANKSPAPKPAAGSDSGSGFLKAVTALVIVLAAFGKKIVAKVKSWF